MFKKVSIIMLIMALLLGLVLFECTLQGDTQSSSQENKKVNDNEASLDGQNLRSGIAQPGSTRVPLYDYPYGYKGILGEKKYLMDEYYEWKSHYITSSGAGGNLRVQRDAMTNYDTVSEGIGYGMLLAVYFDDKDTYRKLKNYFEAHVTSDGLMHWRVDKNGKNIDEFGNLAPQGNFSEIDAYTGKLEKRPRGLSNATDADLDMAAAAVLAFYRWGTTPAAARGYASEAEKLLDAIWKNDIDTAMSTYWLKNGATWGGYDCFNPSYATFAWFQLFKKFSGDTKWMDLYNNMMNVLDAMNKKWGKGLFPDFVGYDVNKQDYVQVSGGRGKCSYNFYYDAVRIPWRLALDYSWYGNSSKSRNIMQNLTDFIGPKTGDFVKTPNLLSKLVDGYFPDGSTWSFEYSDWNNETDEVTGHLNARGNNIKQGGTDHTATFAAMLPTVYVALYNKSWGPKVRAAYEHLKGTKDPYGNDTNDKRYHYFGNTLRLLSLLYMSGNMPDLSSCGWYDSTKEPPEGVYNTVIVRIRNRWEHNCYLHVQHRKSNTVECGVVEDPKWESAQWCIDKNSDGFTLFRCRWDNNPDKYDYYLNIENNGDYLLYGKREDGKAPDTTWHSAQWTLEHSPEKGFFFIKNRWTGKYIHIQNRIPLGDYYKAQYGSIDKSWWSAQWEFERVQ